jgi:DNA-binding NarL/FixJ family response regulator
VTGDSTGDAADATGGGRRHLLRMKLPEQPLRVLIVDPHTAFRGAAKALLETEGLDVVGDLEPGPDAVVAAEELRPDVVLVDVGLEPLDDLELARSLAALPEAPAVVLMSAAPADTLLAASVGADAFFSKAAVSAQLVTGAAVLRGAPATPVTAR